MVVIVMGVSGVGKTTLGQALAAALGWHFEDADAWHPASNVEKMRSGIPLDDHDREPWLQALHSVMTDWTAQGKGVVLACSALKARYRLTLSAGLDHEVRFVFLHASRELVRMRMHSRSGHYMPETLVDSQFAALEPPAASEALFVDASLSLTEQVRMVREDLSRHP
jgi:gluconokinase